MKDADEKAAGRQTAGSDAPPQTFDAAGMQVCAEAVLGFADNLGRVAAEAMSDHVEPLPASERRVSSAVQDIVKARQAPKLIAAQAVFLHARKVGECWAARDSSAIGEGATAMPEPTLSRREIQRTVTA